MQHCLPIASLCIALFVPCNFALAYAAQPRAKANDQEALAALDNLAIAKAIDRGVAYLLSRQLRDGSWSDFSMEYGSGQTALSLYTLLESGVAPSDPVIEAGFAYLDGTKPDKVYSVACQLLAYGELHDATRRERMQGLLEMLLEWQMGTFGYPAAIGGDGTDLSNTQYAALGMLAAHREGLEIPAKAWRRLMEATLAFQERPHETLAKSGDGVSSSATKLMAGFRYRLDPVTYTLRQLLSAGNAQNRAITGSMTTAGVAVLAICREGLGKQFKKRDAQAINRAEKCALQWLTEHFSVLENPGASSWLYYYLYGLERVGTLLGLQFLGTHDWYREGAELLVKQQLSDGAWSRLGSETNTCFALLFLQRATQAVSSESSRKPIVHTGAGMLRLRATGTNPLVVWITGFDEERLRAAGILLGSMRVASVDYYVDGKSIGVIETATEGPWAGERYAQRIAFETVGWHRVSARVNLVPWKASGAQPANPVTLQSDGFQLEVPSTLSEWMLPFAQRAHENLLRGRSVESVVSSGAAPEALLDGLESTCWLADETDLSPSISLRFAKPIKANLIVISGPDARPADRRQHDTLMRAVLRINGLEELEVVFQRDALQPGVLRLDGVQAIRSLEVLLAERIPGSGRRSTVGLAEIGLFLLK